jgi:hypothetical protein
MDHINISYNSPFLTSTMLCQKDIDILFNADKQIVMCIYSIFEYGINMLCSGKEGIGQTQ